MCLQGAFYHTASKTLMVTDAVVYLPVKPPEVCLVGGLMQCLLDMRKQFMRKLARRS